MFHTKGAKDAMPCDEVSKFLGGRGGVREGVI